MDVTREAIKFPAPRSAVLQMLARAETGGIMCLGYSTMRGFAAGGHGTIGELRVGCVRVEVRDGRGRKRYIGRVRVTECELVAEVRSAKKSSMPSLSFGYGLCFGQNETKAICMSMLDNSLRQPNANNPANSQEFVLYHTEVDRVVRVHESFEAAALCDVPVRSAESCVRRLGIRRKSTAGIMALFSGRFRLWGQPVIPDTRFQAVFNFAFLDETTKREIRRKTLKAICIPWLPGAVLLARTSHRTGMGYGWLASNACVDWEERHRQSD